MSNTALLSQVPSQVIITRLLIAGVNPELENREQKIPFAKIIDDRGKRLVYGKSLGEFRQYQHQVGQNTAEFFRNRQSLEFPFCLVKMIQFLLFGENDVSKQSMARIEANETAEQIKAISHR